jgi:hypothetical protein
MAAKVFTSYRRDDAKYQAGMIYAAFCHALSREQVFMDIDSILPGAEFCKILKDEIDKCEVLLARIGAGWIDATDPETGRRRLDNPNDFVRIEIGAALARDIPVFPVLLDRAPLPRTDMLPDDLKALVGRQAEFVDYRTFDADVERLIKKLGLARQPTQLTLVEDRTREGRIKVDAATIHGAPDGWFKPGNGKAEWFKTMSTVPKWSWCRQASS